MAIIALQSAASALTALNTAMDVISNNLANVGTTGFKSSRANFSDLLYINQNEPGIRNLNSEQRPTGLQIGLGTMITGTQLSLTQGGDIKGGKLDLVIRGNGLFRVSVPSSVAPGGIAFTRAGQFAINSDGEMVMATDTGRKLDPPVIINGEVLDVSIDSTGQVSVTRPNQADPDIVGQITLSNFVNPSGLKAIGGNLYSETSASGPPIDGNPEENGLGGLQQGYYEGSNVDPTTELIDLIKVQRAFEMNSNTIRAADQNLQVIAQLRR